MEEKGANVRRKSEKRKPPRARREKIRNTHTHTHTHTHTLSSPPSRKPRHQKVAPSHVGAQPNPHTHTNPYQIPESHSRPEKRRTELNHDVRKTTRQELHIALYGVGMPVRAESTKNQTHPHTRTYVARKNARGNYSVRIRAQKSPSYCI